jgi:glucose-1-phosphate thymidylyltransferase
LREHQERKNTATLALFRAQEPKKHGIAETQGRKIVSIVEKPENPNGNLAFAGMAIFEPEIFPALEQVNLSCEGEYYLTDAINILIRQGKKVGYTVLSGGRVNVNNLKELEQARRLAGSAVSPGENGGITSLQSGKKRDQAAGLTGSR